MIVLYDADCGFCRWAMAWVMERDDRDLLVPAPIQSELGAQLLADLDPDARLRAAHAIDDDGNRRSAGAAVAAVLGALGPAQIPARLAGRLPRLTDLVYGAVARHRIGIGRFVGQRARQRADRLLDATKATTEAELEARSQRSEGSQGSEGWQ